MCSFHKNHYNDERVKKNKMIETKRPHLRSHAFKT